MAFTPEQEAIIASNARLVRANAFAGTGKSTTLRGVAGARPSERALLIAFNKSIQLEAEASFPRNVKCRTSHALAFRDFGRLYTAGGKLQGDLKPFHIAEITRSATAQLPAPVARIFDQRVIETVKAFLVSADDALGAKHVVIGDSPAEEKYLSEVTVLAAAVRVWAAMQDTASPVPMLHDGYLKLYQLSQPRLAFDMILADESQDLNPTLQAILAAQTCRLIYVCDSRQAIYVFSGAHNAMETVNADATFYLTGSFRFGADVAEVANRILARKGITVALRGLGEPTEVAQGPLESVNGSAFISRTNAAVFDKAHRATCSRIPVAYVGGIHTYKFEVGEDISRLQQFGPGDVRNPFIASFKDFEELAEYAGAVNDRELNGWAKVVDGYGARRFDAALRQIRAAALQYDSTDPAQRDALVVVTAHRSKGLEFDRVELAENFIDMLDEETGQLRDFTDAPREAIEEVNLLYVAATRARKQLAVNQSIMQLFDPALTDEAEPTPAVEAATP